MATDPSSKDVRVRRRTGGPSGSKTKDFARPDAKPSEPRRPDPSPSDPQRSEAGRPTPAPTGRTESRTRQPDSRPPATAQGGIRVRHEDADLLILERLPDTSATELRRAIGQRDDDQAHGKRRGAWPVGTLEPGVTGLLLLARSAAARRALERDDSAHFRYWVAVEDRGSAIPRQSAKPARPGEPRVLASVGLRRLLELERTRPHRDLVAWLERRGFRVLRDPSHPERLQLHGCELELVHPVSGKPLRFKSEPPADLGPAGGLVAQDGGKRAVPARAPSEPRGPTALPQTEASSERATRDVSAQRPDFARSDRKQVRQFEKRDGDSASSATPPRTDWDHVADWFDGLLEQSHDHYQDVVLPGTLRLLEVARGMRVLDVACGQGLLCRELAQRGIEAVGVEASARLVELARERSSDAKPQPSFHQLDARELEASDLGRFERAACVLALTNIEPIEPVLRSIAAALEPAGRLVIVLPHPAFRVPKQSRWEWDRDDTGAHRQSRRVDAYLSAARSPIVANPGAVARGERAVETWTFHRPLEHYVNALAAAGLLTERLEEWRSRRKSDSGPRAAAENRARNEIPLFLALRARKL